MDSGKKFDYGWPGIFIERRIILYGILPVGLSLPDVWRLLPIKIRKEVSFGLYEYGEMTFLPVFRTERLSGHLRWRSGEILYA